MKASTAKSILERAAERWPSFRVEPAVFMAALQARYGEQDPPASWAGEDFALAAAVVAGDRQAWEVFYLEYHVFIQRVLQRHCRTQTDAEEIAQDFCGEAAGRLKNFAGRCSLHGWLAVVMPNVARDWYRRRGKEASLDELLEARNKELPGGISEPVGIDGPAAAGLVEQIVDGSPCERMLKGSLSATWERLDQAERTLLEYKFFHGLKSREIGAVILKVREDVVSKRLKRALRELGRGIRRHALAHFHYSAEEVGHCVELVLGRMEPFLPVERVDS